MKSLEEKRDELSDELCLHQDFSMLAGFNIGWDACAKEYEQENAELKRQLEIAKEALNKIGGRQLEQISGMYEFIAESALKDLESAGE